MSIVVRKVNVPWAIDRKNYYTFSSVDERRNYMIARGISYVINDTDRAFTFRDGYIDLDLTSEIASSLKVGMHWKYVMITTENEDFFYFVTRFEYINLHTTRIYLEPDYITTYLPYITPVSSFVERGHVNLYEKQGSYYNLKDDSVKYLTSPEPYEVGEYRCKKVNSIIINKPVAVIALDGSFLPDETDFSTRIGNISDVALVICGLTRTTYNDTVIESANEFLRVAEQSGKTNHILNVSVYPAGLPGVSIGNESYQPSISFDSNFGINIRKITSTATASFLWITDVTSSLLAFRSLGNLDYVDQYTTNPEYDPKCYCQPYSYFAIIIENTIQSIYNPAYVKPPGVIPSNLMYYYAFIGSECSDMAYIENVYGEVSSNTKFHSSLPSLYVESDQYRQYLYENRSRIISSRISNAKSAVFQKDIINGIDNEITLQSRISDLKLLPTTPISSADNNQYSAGFVSYLNIANYQQQEDGMQHLTELFLKYGYTINDVIVPDLNSRPAWNYIKSPEFNFTSNTGIPQDAIKAIKDIFASGVTLWHYNGTSDTMYDTSLDNREVFA